MGRTLTAMAKALSFTHLSAAGARPRAADDEDSRSGRAQRAADDDQRDPDDDKDKDKQGQRAGDDSNDGRDQGTDDSNPDKDDKDDKGDDTGKDDDSGKGKRGRKAKRARAQDDEGDEDDDDDRQAEDDDDETEMRGQSVAAAARRREQARCATIFASKAAAHNPTLAANLAFKTRLPRGEAVAMLEASPPAAGSFPAERAARNPRVGPGNSAQLNSRQAIAASWDHAFAKVNPRAR